MCICSDLYSLSFSIYIYIYIYYIIYIYIYTYIYIYGLSRIPYTLILGGLQFLEGCKLPLVFRAERMPSGNDGLKECPAEGMNWIYQQLVDKQRLLWQHRFASHFVLCSIRACFPTPPFSVSCSRHCHAENTTPRRLHQPTATHIVQGMAKGHV